MYELQTHRTALALGFLLLNDSVVLAQAPSPSPAALGAPAPAPPRAIPIPPVPADQVQGVVLLPNGQPASKARIGIVRGFSLGRTTPGPLIIDADDAGAFRIAVKGNESATLRAHLVPFAATSSLQVRGGQRVTLRLVEGGSANGDVLDAKSSAPIAVSYTHLTLPTIYSV